MPTYRIQLRRDTHANFSSTTLDSGEFAVATDKQTAGEAFLKVGDGSTAWGSMPYLPPATNPTGGSNNYAPVASPTLTGNVVVGTDGGSGNTFATHGASTLHKGYSALDNCTIGASDDKKNLTVNGTLTVGGNLAGGAANILPPGVILPFADDTVPTGFLLCNGQSVSKTTYAALYAALDNGNIWGFGTATFKIPDLRERVLVGVDNMNSQSGEADGDSAGRMSDHGTSTEIGSTAGAQRVALGESHLPSHGHFLGNVTTQYIAGGSTGEYPPTNWSNNDCGAGKFWFTGAGFWTGYEGTSGVSHYDHANVQPTMILNYIIST